MTARPSFSEIWQQIRGQPVRAFLIGLVGLTLMNVDHSLFSFVLTEFSEEFGWSLVERGWYIAITFIVAGLMITQLGVLADKVDALYRHQSMFGGAPGEGQATGEAPGAEAAGGDQMVFSDAPAEGGEARDHGVVADRQQHVGLGEVRRTGLPHAEPHRPPV